MEITDALIDFLYNDSKLDNFSSLTLNFSDFDIRNVPLLTTSELFAVCFSTRDDNFAKVQLDVWSDQVGRNQICVCSRISPLRCSLLAGIVYKFDFFVVALKICRFAVRETCVCRAFDVRSGDIWFRVPLMWLWIDVNRECEAFSIRFNWNL